MTDFERAVLFTIAKIILVVFVGGGSLLGWLYGAALWEAWKEGRGKDDFFNGGAA